MKARKVFIFLAAVMAAVSIFISGCGGSAGTGSLDDGSNLGTISGRVTRLDNSESMPGVEIRLNRANAHIGAKTGEYTATTDENGDFQIGAIPKGHYNFTASHTGFFKYNANVEVIGEKTTTVNIQMDPSTGVTGRIVTPKGQGIANAQVSLNYEIKTIRNGSEKTRKSILNTTTTDARGNYSFMGIGPGSYNVVADHPNYLPNSEPVNVNLDQVSQKDVTLYWKLAYNGHGETLLGMWGTAADNVFTVGTLGAIKHYNGSEWKYVYSGMTDTLWDIWGKKDASLMLIAGPYNFVVRSTDGGKTWEKVPVNADDSFYCLWGSADGTKIMGIGFDGGVFLSQDGGLTWQKKGDLSAYTPPEDYNYVVSDLWCPDNGERFYAVTTNGKILVSDDLGANWTVQHTDSKNRVYLRVWGAGDGSLVVACGYDGSLAYLDGGQIDPMWSESSFVDGLNFQCIALWGAPDGDKIVVGGINDADSNKNVMTTTKINLIEDLPWTQAQQKTFIGGDCWMTDDGQTIYFSSYVSQVFRSNDGGATWPDDPMTRGESGMIVDIRGFSANEVYAVGYDGTALKYDGTTWKKAPAITNTDYSITSITGRKEPGGTTIFFSMLAPLERIKKSEDGLENLTADYFDAVDVINNPKIYNYYYYDVEYLPSNNLLAVGMDDVTKQGVIMMYVEIFPNWWACWVLHTVPDIEFKKIYLPQDASYILAVGTKGTISKWDPVNGGRNIASGAARDLYNIWGMPDGSLLYATGYKIALKSTDQGETWTQVEVPELRGALYGLWGSAPDNIYVSGKNIMRYDGTKWEKMFTSSDLSGETSVFSALTIWGAPDGGKVFAGGLGGRIYEYDKP